MAVVGRILLAILGVLLLLLLFILFLPIVYRVEAQKDTEGLRASAKVSWFFGIVRFLFSYPQPGKPILKIAFFTVFGKDRKKKGGKPEKSRRKAAGSGAKITGNEKAEEGTLQAVSPVTDRSGSEEAESERTETENSDQESAEAEKTEAEKPDSESSEAEKAEREKGDSEKNEAEKTEAVKSDPEREETKEPKAESSEAEKADPAETDTKKEEGPKAGKKESETGSRKQGAAKDRLDHFIKEFQFYRELWHEEDTQPFVKAVFARVLHIMRNLIPRKVEGRLIFGAASPDMTGYLYGAYCVISTLFPKRVLFVLEPDFEEAHMEVDVMVRGYFNLITLLWDGLRILLDRRLRKIKKKLDAHNKKK